MTNWCLNTVRFFGEEQKLREIDWLFNVMDIQQDKTRQGQLPPFIDANQGYFYDIVVEEGEIKDETLTGQNTDILVQIADHFGVGFLHEYYEPGRWIYGEAVYKDQMLSDICIESEDVSLVEYRGDEGYLFEGRSYQTDMEILELLLERKKNGPDNTAGYRR
jgi:hypothetical protein